MDEREAVRARVFLRYRYRLIPSIRSRHQGRMDGRERIRMSVCLSVYLAEKKKD